MLKFNLSLFLLLCFLFLQTLCCLRDYVPDFDKSEEPEIFEIKPIFPDLPCECGKQFSSALPGAVNVYRSQGAASTCSGTLINDRIILTSVLCLISPEKWQSLDLKTLFVPISLDPNDIKVSIRTLVPSSGSSTSSTTEKWSVKSVRCHPKVISSYLTSRFIDNDICILELNDHLEASALASKISPSCISTLPGTDFNGLKGTVDAIDGPYESLIFDNVQCERDTSRQLCTQPTEPQFHKTYAGSSVGSPLMVSSTSGKLVQVGIYSYFNLKPSEEEIKVRLMSVFTNVSSIEILSFILTISENTRSRWCIRSNEEFKFPAREIRRQIRDFGVNTEPWKGFPSIYRKVSKSCECGVKSTDRQKKAGSTNRIVRGEDAIPNDYQWQVKLIIDKSYENPPTASFCGGTLINTRIVLTAAHCVSKTLGSTIPYSPNIIKVIVRAHKGFKDYTGSEQGAKTLKVLRTFVHPNFVYTEGSNEKVDIAYDIAIIVLKKPVRFSTTAKLFPVCLPWTDEYKSETAPKDDFDINIAKLIGMKATVIGWGRVDSFKLPSLQETSNVLQKLNVPIRPYSECFNHIINIPQGVVCAGNFKQDRYQDVYHGDSGGPLMVRGVSKSSQYPQMVQVGVVSAGSFASVYDDRDAIVFYTSTAHYLPFIDFLSYQVGAVWCHRNPDFTYKSIEEKDN